MKSWKNLLVGAAVIGASVMLVACSSNSKSTSNAKAGVINMSSQKGYMKNFKADETFKAASALNLSMMYRDSPNYPVKNSWMLWSELEKNQNVTFKRTDIPLSDYPQKRSTLIAAGQTPEIVTAVAPGEETQFVAGGQILPVSDYLKYMPNLSARLKEWKLTDLFNSHKQKDGKVYILPQIGEVPTYDYTFAYRSDIFEKAGIKAPTTLDEFTKALETLKAKYPSVTPYSDRWQFNAIPNIVAPQFNTSAGWGYSNATYDKGDNKFVFTGTTPDYKKFVSYYSNLVQKGLMDKESLTQTDDTETAKFINGQSFVIGTNGSEFTTLQKNLQAKHPDEKVAMMTVPAGENGLMVQDNRIAAVAGMMLSSKLKNSDHFLATLQFIDWLLYSDSGQTFARWGVEGTTYTKSGDTYTLAKDVNTLGLNPSGTKDLQKDFGFRNGVFYAVGSGSKALIYSQYNDVTKEFSQAMDKNTKIVATAPVYPMSSTDLEQFSLLDTPLKDFVTAQTQAFVSGQRPMSQWSSYVKDVQAKNSAKLIDMVNKAYKAAK